MTQWTYAWMTYQRLDSDWKPDGQDMGFIEWLNEQGANGWELISHTKNHLGTENFQEWRVIFWCLMKRAITGGIR